MNLPLLRRYPALLDVIEVAVILVFLFFATQNLQAEARDHTRPPGVESAYLLSSGAVAAETFQRFGAIPLWNPLVGRGEPVFESLFSFVLNPFMSVPLLALGVIEGGKAAIMLHIVLMALGGWAMGRALKLHAGAVVLGLVLAASGGMNAGLNRGFYQIGLSLAYAPWVYAGMIGLLYRDGIGEHPRRWLGIFAVSLALMMFAGTYWFVVPVMIGCGVIALFALYKPERPELRGERFRRLIVAGAFCLGFAALSLIPRLNSYLVFHPAQGLGGDTYDLFQIINSFFVPDKLTTADWWFAYQYMMPGWFALAVIGGRAALFWKQPPFARWRVLIPAALLILFFCVWAQDNTPLFQFIYAHSFLVQWRWPARMAAAAAPFVGLVIALWFDEIIRLLLRLHLVLWVGALVVAGVGLYAASQAFWNWDNMFNFDPYGETTPEYQVMATLRADHPGAFLPLTTEGLLPHIGAYELGIRSSFGNPDVYTNGLPSDPGFDDVMDWDSPFAFATNDGYRAWLRERGYVPAPDSPLDEGGGTALMINPDALPYAFIVQRETVAGLQGARLTAAQVNPAGKMDHYIDRIEFTVENYKFNSLLVVQEVNYPGWTVTVDGQPAQIVSFDELLAVALPLNAHSVVFEYHAPLLVIGLIVYLITLALFIGYLFHVDERIRGTRYDPTPRLRSLNVQMRRRLNASLREVEHDAPIPWDDSALGAGANAAAPASEADSTPVDETPLIFDEPS